MRRFSILAAQRLHLLACAREASPSHHAIYCAFVQLFGDRRPSSSALPLHDFQGLSDAHRWSASLVARHLLDAFNEAKKTAGLTIVLMLVTGLVLALLAGAFVKLKVFGGGQ